MSEETQRWTIGDVTLTAIVEAETSGIPVQFFFPEATAADVQSARWLSDGAADADGNIAFRVQAFVIQRGRRLVLVDPCVGNSKKRGLEFWDDLSLPWMERFETAGFDAASVDLVVHTHLHEDHIGWDTHLSNGLWVPTFPNARHVYVGEELDYARLEERRINDDPFADSIEPILDAGLGWEVGPTADLGDGMALLSTPGHTPGHVSLVVETGADQLVVSGDLSHHQFQFQAPAFAETADWNAELARQTRSAFFSEYAQSGAIIAGTHFAGAPVGRIEPLGAAWQFHPQS